MAPADRSRWPARPGAPFSLPQRTQMHTAPWPFACPMATLASQPIFSLILANSSFIDNRLTDIAYATQQFTKLTDFDRGTLAQGVQASGVANLRSATPPSPGWAGRVGRCLGMLTISKPMKRHSVRYYNDTAREAISASADRQAFGGGLAEYYSEGETRAPVWVCAGGTSRVGDAEKAADLVGLSVVDRAGGPADMDAVARWLDEGIAPNGARGRAFSARSTHGFDLTFCAPKSVSLLRALGGDDVLSKAVVDAHDSAVREALEYLYDHAGYTRVHNPETGCKDLVRLPGLVMAAYQHETSRAGDPHLHTHVLLPNRQARSDGALVSIDSKSLHHEAKAAGIIYQATLRQHLLQSMGVEWGPIDPHTGMAEVAGVDRATIRAWSQRSTQLREWAEQNLVVDDEVGASAAQLAAGQKATRPAKPEHLSWAELKHLWALDQRGFAVDETAQLAARRARTSTRFDVHALARDAATGIDKSAFTRADLVEAIGARMPLSIEGVNSKFDANTAPPRYLIEGIADLIGLRITAPRLAHEREGHERFTTAAVIAEEAALLDLMGSRDERAALAPAALDTAGLSADQAAAITAIATSPWLIQPLSAPAGAGKTTSLKALRAAAHRGGKPRVVVLAPTGKAVDIAVREGAGDTGYTVAKAVKALRTQELTFDARTLVVVDEAGMVGTSQLREVLAATTAAGAKTVLVGDAFQLAPVKARGGMFAQLVDDLPWAQKLSEVWRMRDPDERTASLAVRNGGPKPLRRAVAWYRTHNRLRTGDAVTMANDALKAYQADRAAGKDALLMTDRWDVCDALNTRLHRDTVAPDAPTLAGARGHHIGVGDVIISRRNDATVPVVDATDTTTAAEPVRNGHRWRVYKIDTKNHRIYARRIGDRARAMFDGDYLAEHVHYGYAVTVHASQGATAGDAVTAGTAHALLSESATRNLAYVALTRGRDANHVYLYDTTTGEADHEHNRAEQPRGVHPATRGTSRDAATALRAVLGRDDRSQTLTAAATDRTHQPPEVRALLTKRDRVRTDLRIEHHIDTSARDLAAALPALRAELDVADTAGRAHAWATRYPVPEAALDHLDDTHRRVVTAIAGDEHAVQSLHLYPGADKAAALAAIADAAHRGNRPVIAFPATPDAQVYAGSHCYADNADKVLKTPTDTVVTRMRELAADGRRLPRGNLVIVDDADHLHPKHLQWLADNAAATNTKLLLITTPDHRTPAHTLTAALDHLLPWAQQLGTPDPAHQRPRSAIERADHHLATTPPGAELPAHHAARDLLRRRDQLLDHFDDMRRFEEQLHEIFERNRARARDQDRGYDFGLGL
ncbi:MobF family relaxase [Mycobacterium avium]|uniref:MobF family relaxase n=3 Tax=Mycobacterium avium TaxID=1764 RepID=UPI003742CB0C